MWVFSIRKASAEFLFEANREPKAETISQGQDDGASTVGSSGL